MRVLVLGATGMLGNAVFRVLHAAPNIDVLGTIRSPSARQHFDAAEQVSLADSVDVLDTEALVRLFADFRPSAVVNCVGVIKQHEVAHDPLLVLPVNALLPHKLAQLCRLSSARLVHISTDCVFSGNSGKYKESDTADATDLYGRSKHIGEVVGWDGAITLRTSIIGHELTSNLALVDWFLSQKEFVSGYARAIFSGLPTIALAKLIRDRVLPDPKLHGLYHVSVDPIDKFSLLVMIAETYGKTIEIRKDTEVRIDRSLDSSRFRVATGYEPTAWRSLIKEMYADSQSR